MNNLKKYYGIALIFSVVFSSNAFALIYDEAIDGPLSNDPSAITNLDFNPGSNTVSGLVDNFFFGDGDFFSFSLEEGETLTAVNLLAYTPFTIDLAVPSSFFGIGDFSNPPERLNDNLGLVPGDPNTELFTSRLFTEDDLGPVDGPGFNLLDLANRTNFDEAGNEIEFIEGFTGSLGPGVYWIWLSELDGEFEFELEFLIESQSIVEAPIPASLFLLMGPLAFVLRRKK